MTATAHSYNTRGHSNHLLASPRWQEMNTNDVDNNQSNKRSQRVPRMHTQVSRAIDNVLSTVLPIVTESTMRVSEQYSSAAPRNKRAQRAQSNPTTTKRRVILKQKRRGSKKDAVVVANSSLLSLACEPMEIENVNFANDCGMGDAMQIDPLYNVEQPMLVQDRLSRCSMM